MGQQRAGGALASVEDELELGKLGGEKVGAGPVLECEAEADVLERDGVALERVVEAVL